MNTSVFDSETYLSWSLLDPRPCLYNTGDSVVVFWNGHAMTYNMALALTADVLFQTPISYGISDQIFEDYEKMCQTGINPQADWAKIKQHGNRAAYNAMRKKMVRHIEKLGSGLKNKKQALAWFNKETCVNAQKS
jgi:hypothetical protein